METLNRISLIGLSGVALFAAILTISKPLLPNQQFNEKLSRDITIDPGGTVLNKPSEIKVSIETPSEFIFVTDRPKYWL